MDSEHLYTNVRFIRSVTGARPQDLADLPEIAIAGRSNAGKSSLINYLSGRRQLAHTGKQPGKTRLINYFLVDDAWYLVDLPGYGYAKASKQETASWGQMMEAFFAETSRLAGLIICMDIRRDPSPEDLQMAHWAVYFQVPFIVAATKADKVAKSKRPQECARIRKLMPADAGAAGAEVFPVSAAGRSGGSALKDAVDTLLKAPETP